MLSACRIMCVTIIPHRGVTIILRQLANCIRVSINARIYNDCSRSSCLILSIFLQEYIVRIYYYNYYQYHYFYLWIFVVWYRRNCTALHIYLKMKESMSRRIVYFCQILAVAIVTQLFVIALRCCQPYDRLSVVIQTPVVVAAFSRLFFVIFSFSLMCVHRLCHYNYYMCDIVCVYCYHCCTC